MTDDDAGQLDPLPEPVTQARAMDDEGDGLVRAVLAHPSLIRDYNQRGLVMEPATARALGEDLIEAADEAGEGDT